MTKKKHGKQAKAPPPPPDPTVVEMFAAYLEACMTQLLNQTTPPANPRDFKLWLQLKKLAKKEFARIARKAAERFLLLIGRMPKSLSPTRKAAFTRDFALDALEWALT